MAASETDRVGPIYGRGLEGQLSAHAVLFSAARSPFGELYRVVIGPEMHEIILGSSVSMWLRIAVNRDENRPAPRRMCRLEQ